MKELNEEYLQQRIEGLEKKAGWIPETSDEVSAWNRSNELKQLLANCKEVDFEIIENVSLIDLEDEWLKDETHNLTFREFLKQEGYKLIKVKL